MNKTLAELILLLFAMPAIAETADTLMLGQFSAERLENWESKEFQDITDYRLVKLDNTTVLKAQSNSSASGLFREQRIDLQKTPYLNWQWRIENRLGKINEQQKSGDDYPARIYIVVKGGWAFWNTKAINYVWASNSTKGKIWPNAFAGDHAMMMALRSTEDQTGTWYQEKRNILEDLKQLFGEDIRYIDAVAIMTDTDNVKGSAVAYYGDIYFTRN